MPSTWSLKVLLRSLMLSSRNVYAFSRYVAPTAVRTSPAGSSNTLPSRFASQTDCTILPVSFSGAEMASRQSCETTRFGSNGLSPLVHFAELAPKPPPAALPVRENPAPKNGADITVRSRASDAVPVVSELVTDSPRWTVVSQFQSTPGILPSRPTSML